ncbi:MAG: Asp23/Gls24 family envelope stress response protein [Candidatus Atribacteria bacterium]|nr:Asp23/Gls24 family envelope stress response protein [Candidatus Atribacteria bacterium]
MELARVATDLGNINISRDIIETLIQLILQNVDGIIFLKRSALRKRRKFATSKSDGKQKRIDGTKEIRVDIKQDYIIINLFLVIRYGIRIPDLTWEVQAKIKEGLKEETGLNIDQINVHIREIRFSKKYYHGGELITPEAFLKIF